MSRNKPIHTRSGVILQAGLGMQPRGTRKSLAPLGPLRGLVLATHTYESEDNLRKTTVECDVLLMKAQTTVFAVPVMQLQHGVNHAHAPWVPRITTRVVDADGQTLNLARQLTSRGAYIGPVTNFSRDVDGDIVVLEYMDDNIDTPVIRGAYPHPRSKRRIVSSEGWREGDQDTRGTMSRDEFYVHHAGTEVRINEQGDFLIDTVGATADIVDEVPSADAGQVRFRVKDSQRFTIAMADGAGGLTDVLEVWRDGTQIKVDLGENATEQMILGNSFQSFINTFFNTKFNLHTHAVPTGGTTGVPLPAFIADLMPETLLSLISRTKRS